MARNRIPSYRLHTPSGNAVVTLCGKDFYLGVHGSKTSKREYDRLITEWTANNRQLPTSDSEGPTVAEIIVAFLHYAPTYYVGPDGNPTSEVANFKLALKPMRKLYGPTPAKDFGPLSLRAVQEVMIGMGLARHTINRQVGRIKSFFKWAVSRQMIPPTSLLALQSVAGLRRGRSEARETDPVRPVPVDIVNATLPFLPAPVQSIVRLQLLTGARPGELLKLRPLDLDMSSKVWISKAADHKNEWRGHSRTLCFGPKAQGVIRPFLNRPVDACLFNPAEATREMREERHAARSTPLCCGNRIGTNRAKSPTREPGNHYNTDSYRRAITRACDQAFPPPAPLVKRDDETITQWEARLTEDQQAELQAWQREHRWHPHQLRHTAATLTRKEFGPDAARALLGHRSLVATAIYAELDAATVQAIVSKIG